MKFRKKPVEVEARQFTGGAESATPIIDWILDNGGTATWQEAAEPADNGETGHSGWPEALRIKTLEGVMEASPGDWIIRGIQGEFYPCKPDIFEATYTAVGDEEPLSILLQTSDYRGDHDADVAIAHEYVPGETVSALVSRVLLNAKQEDRIELRLLVGANHVVVS